MTEPKLPARWTDDVRRGTRRGARLPTRAELRELVAEHQMEIDEVVAVGANPKQLTLDHQKKLRAYAANLSGQDATAFLRMYAEEMTAATANKTSDNRMLASGPAPSPMRARGMAPIVGVAVVLFVLLVIVMFRACA
jgi:hypothetical protein